MRTAILISLIIPTLALSQTPTHTWQVETAQRPASYAIEIIRGESITLAPQYLSNGVAMTLPGSATAALRYRSADMVADTYYSLSGTVTGSTARFSWASTNCAPATNYTYAIAITGSGVNLRSYGTLKLIGVVSGTQTSAPTLYAPYPWETAVPVLSNSFLGNGAASVNGSPITNGSSITVSAALPAGAITATNQGLPGQSFFFSAGTTTGTYTGYFATAAGSGDMLASVYDPNGVQRGVVFTNDARYLAALTNPAAFDPAGSAAALTNAITNALESASSAAQQSALATNLITTHTNNLSNPHQVTTGQIGAVATNDVRYLAALTNAAVFDPAGSSAALTNAITNALESAASAAQQAAIATNTITTHTNNLSNPHQVTAAQLNAVTNYQCDPQTMLTLTNTSPLTITAQVNRVYSITAIGSSNITVALEGTNCIGESWLNLNITQTNGGTTWFWPSGLYHWNRGTGSSNAPGVSNYGRVEIYHNAQQFLAFHLWTNTPLGAP